MLNTDIHAASIISLGTSLEVDTRLTAGDREFCVYYRTKLATQITDPDEDLRFSGIYRKMIPIFQSNKY